MVKNAGLVRAQKPASLGVADVPRVTGEVDARVKLHHLSHGILLHSEGNLRTINLICQIKLMQMRNFSKHQERPCSFGRLPLLKETRALAISRWAHEAAKITVFSTTMATATTQTVDWKLIWAQRGFRYFFVAMFVSLFGSGMNFAGVSWYILAATHSTVKVSWQVIVMTLPGLFVPFLGGVLIDRIDRRYLGVLLDLVRGCFVLATAYVAWRGHLQLWHLYAMTLITGTGSAMYWATVNALVQEVIPAS